MTHRIIVWVTVVALFAAAGVQHAQQPPNPVDFRPTAIAVRGSCLSAQ
jgi:hypothetical protein